MHSDSITYWRAFRDGVEAAHASPGSIRELRASAELALAKATEIAELCGSCGTSNPSELRKTEYCIVCKPFDASATCERTLTIHG